jgi:TonB family protein
LEVSVTVNGARTVAGSDKREPFSESTKTVLIFVNGAVVRLASAVAPGQLLFLTNEKTKKEVVCQVVKSKNYQNITGYVELEFTEPVAGFWGMRFPAAGPAQPTPSAPSAPANSPKPSTGNFASESKPQNTSASLSPERKSPAPSLPRVSLPTTAAPSVSASQPPAPSSPASAIHPQIPAAGTRLPSSVIPVFPPSPKPSNVVEISRPSVAASEAAGAAKHSTPPSKSLLDTDEVKIPSWLEPLARNAATTSAADNTPAEHLPDEYPMEVEDPPVTEVAETPEPAYREDPAPAFRAHFLSEEHHDVERATSNGSGKKVLIGAVAAGLLLLAGGGALYLRQRPSSSAPSTAAAVIPTTENVGAGPAESTTPAAAQPAPSGTYQAVSTPASANGLPAGAVAAKSVDAANTVQNKRLATVDAAPAAARQPKKPTLGTVNLANPIVNQPAGGQDRPAEALNLEASSVVPQPADRLSSDLVDNSKQPAAPPVPLPVGGKVKAARLISSVSPTYPSIARSQRLAGDVKLDALIDVTGRVSKMAVISGPPLLRDSAMDALHQWKYEPAQLDGKPVQMHLTVTIQFKLQ